MIAQLELEIYRLLNVHPKSHVGKKNDKHISYLTSNYYEAMGSAQRE